MDMGVGRGEEGKNSLNYANEACKIFVGKISTPLKWKKIINNNLLSRKCRVNERK